MSFKGPHNFIVMALGHNVKVALIYQFSHVYWPLRIVYKLTCLPLDSNIIKGKFIGILWKVSRMPRYCYTKKPDTDFVIVCDQRRVQDFSVLSGWGSIPFFAAICSRSESSCYTESEAGEFFFAKHPMVVNSTSGCKMQVNENFNWIPVFCRSFCFYLECRGINSMWRVCL